MLAMISTGLDPTGEFNEDSIANFVAMVIVDLLEVIKVHHDDGEVIASINVFLLAFSKPFEEGTSIMRAG